MMNSHFSEAFFITGTNTGAGKTEVTLGLMRAFKQRGYAVNGMKPVASGAEKTEQGLRNEDALKIMSEISPQCWLNANITNNNEQYSIVNPYAFEPAVSPNIAAEQAGDSIRAENILASLTRLRESSDYTFIEGVGGWMAPIDHLRSMQEVAMYIGVPVILVVGLELGALNHSLLTFEAIKHSELPLAGWVVSVTDPDMLCVDENIKTLELHFDCAPLAVIAHANSLTTESIASEINIDCLLA